MPNGIQVNMLSLLAIIQFYGISYCKIFVIAAYGRVVFVFHDNHPKLLKASSINLHTGSNEKLIWKPFECLTRIVITAIERFF